MPNTRVKFVEMATKKGRRFQALVKECVRSIFCFMGKTHRVLTYYEKINMSKQINKYCDDFGPSFVSECLHKTFRGFSYWCGASLGFAYCSMKSLSLHRTQTGHRLAGDLMGWIALAGIQPFHCLRVSVPLPCSLVANYLVLTRNSLLSLHRLLPRSRRLYEDGSSSLVLIASDLAQVVV